MNIYTASLQVYRRTTSRIAMSSRRPVKRDVMVDSNLSLDFYPASHSRFQHIRQVTSSQFILHRLFQTVDKLTVTRDSPHC